MQSTLHILFRSLLLASFSLWYGGFIFYVSFVVPIGTELLGSARTQGFITQQVTHRLNIVCGIAVALMLMESFLSWRQTRGLGRSIMLAASLLCLGFLVGLVWIHPIMDSLISLENGTISDQQRFYRLHRVYLWLCTLQWAAGGFWLVFLMVNWKTSTGTRHHRVSS